MSDRFQGSVPVRRVTALVGRICARPAMMLLLAPWLAALCAGAERHTVSYDHNCYQVDGKDIYLYSGSIHYMRCPRELWADRLLKIKRAGFNTVQTIIPWNYHEPEAGALDLSELDDWLSLCESMGFYLAIRPGPFICGEWDNGGYPDWLTPKRLLLRSHTKEYMEYVGYWYDRVLPVIRRHLITNGGGVILVQLENEYGGGAEYKADAIRTMYGMVRQRGIDVPLFTVNTPWAEDNEEPIMASINNGWDVAWCRWETAESKVANNIRRVRNAEFNAPTLGADIPGGGGIWAGYVRLPNTGNWQIPPLDRRDYNAVSKTVWMEGAAQSNYYMLFGGTNFGYWAASYMSSSYWNRPPVECPLLEPGGLGESYYTVKLMGQWLRTFGARLVRARHCAEDAISASGTSKKPPRVLQRVHGDLTFMLIRDEQDADQRIRIAYTDPATGQTVTAPRNDYLTLEARGTRVLAANVPLSKLLLKYATSEILAIERCGERIVVALYGPDGSPGEACLRCEQRPHVLGDVKQSWSESEGELTLNYIHQERDRYVVVDDVELLILNRKRARTTWRTPWGDQSGYLVSDCYLMRDCRLTDDGCDLNVECLPGRSHVAMVLPATPQAVQLDGQSVPFAWNEQAGVASFDLTTEKLPNVAVEFKYARFMRERASADDGGMKVKKLTSLEDLGVFEKGYVRYRATFEADSAKSIVVRYFEGSAKSGRSHQTVGDPAAVFFNGKYAPEASGWHQRKITLDAKDYLEPGKNTVEVLLEKIGQPCGAGGWGMGEPKGLASVSLIGLAPKPWIKLVENWQVTPGLHGQVHRYFARDHDVSSWRETRLGDWKRNVPGAENFDGIGWYRLGFDHRPPEGWKIPLKLRLKAETDALVYLNDKVVGRYIGMGWQREFYLPESWMDSGGANVITIAVRNAGRAGGLLEASIRPYREFSVREHTIQVAFPGL